MRFLCAWLIVGLFSLGSCRAELFDASNLAAWCIVPFDKAKRGPEQRAAMLEKLGITKFVYDYRAEHVPMFASELEALERYHIELLGWWFPAVLNDEALMTLELFKRYRVHPQLWVTGGGERPQNKAELAKRLAEEVARLRPIAEAAAAQGLQVGLYNHGGWFGEPETQLAIIEALALPNVGMVYNLHHGHDHVRRLRQILEMIRPHLLCLNLNGMMEEGEKRGMKIVPLGQGDQDLEVLKIIAASGYTGPIGLLNHTDEDAEERLLDNLDGLHWLVKQLHHEDAGDKPVPRSWTRPAESSVTTSGWSAGDKPAYHKRPFTLECRAELHSKANYNILVARDVKASADHWELYTEAGRGTLAFFQPGRGGVLGSTLDVCDGHAHDFTAIVEEQRVRLFVDGQPVAEAAAKPLEGTPIPGPLQLGGLVEQTLGCDGLISFVRLSKDVCEPSAQAAPEQTIEEWKFDAAHPPATPATPKPTSFFYQFDPLHPELWPNRQAEINHYRLYDFYAKEALAFRGKKAVSLVISHPGVDGNLFGHWGRANEDEWRDGRWASAKRAPLQSGILYATKGSAYPKAVVFQIGEHEEMTTCFDPETLSFPFTSKGDFVGMSNTRHGMMDGLHFNAPITLQMEATKPRDPFVYHGFYRHGQRLIFSYERHGQAWLDTAWTQGANWQREIAPAGGDTLGAMTKGGPPRWPEWLETKGTLGTHRPYALDTLTFPPHPDGHPWFIGGMDFFSDGTAALCTMEGDVWLVKGIDATLEHLRWKRFASGLSQALGLRIVDGKIYVQGRDQITRLHDLNGDDEADFYECVSNAQSSSAGGHDFITGCESDGKHFYFASANQGICRVEPGHPVEVLATGFRNPNGLGLGKDGTLTTTCQEGEWTPASMICQIQPGRFYGYGGPKEGQVVSPPLCYLPRGVDNSCGGQCFTETTRWGPLGGQLIHFSSGAANHFLILRQTVGDLTQGAAVALPGDFASGVQQGRTNPLDGQLYATGMNGWGCWAPEDGCFQRVRYTGGPAHLPTEFALHENGIWIKFSDPLGTIAEDVPQHFAQCWNYFYSAAYGCPELSVSQPKLEGHDVLPITAAHLSADRRSLFLEIPLLTPCHQVHVHVRTIDDQSQDLFITAHRLAPPFTDFPGYQPAAKQFILAAATQASQQALPNPWSQGAAGRTVKVEAAPGLKFAQAELHAQAGERLSLTFANPDVVPHNWVLIQPGKLASIGEAANQFISNPAAVFRHYVPESSEVLAYTDMVNAGGEFTIHFNAPAAPGQYPYLCTFPGHWGVMHGVLVVE